MALRNGFLNDQKRDVSLSMPLPAVEVSIAQNLPLPGSRTSQVKVLSERYDPRSLTLELEGQSGTQFSLGVRTNITGVPLKAKGALLGEVREDGLRAAVVSFAPGIGYTNTTVVLSW